MRQNTNLNILMWAKFFIVNRSNAWKCFFLSYACYALRIVGMVMFECKWLCVQYLKFKLWPPGLQPFSLIFVIIWNTKFAWYLKAFTRTIDIISLIFTYDCVEKILSSNRPYRPSLSHVTDRPSLGGLL